MSRCDLLQLPDLELERRAMAQGCARVAGVDEAGRGPLAGPVVVAAAALHPGFVCSGVRDSKQLTEKRREELFDSLCSETRLDYRIEIVDVETIDQLNILHATWLGMRRAVSCLQSVGVDFALLDGCPVPDFPVPNQSVVKGDCRSQSIAVASILAKVTRDRIMRELAKEFPLYGFDRHKGYPTRMHLEKLRDHGPVAAHRRSFAPVARFISAA
jgi:ribonuclease HII